MSDINNNLLNQYFNNFFKENINSENDFQELINLRNIQNLPEIIYSNIYDAIVNKIKKFEIISSIIKNDYFKQKSLYIEDLINNDSISSNLLLKILEDNFLLYTPYDFVSNINCDSKVIEIIFAKYNYDGYSYFIKTELYNHLKCPQYIKDKIHLMNILD